MLPKIISRDNFVWILTTLHPEPSTIETILNSNFKQYWTPEQHVSIDEGLVCFKGRYQNRVHIRGKPEATGLKIYSLVDSLGYLWSFWQYDGEKSTVSDIVHGFTDQLPSTRYKVYADSWFGSDQLAIDLHQQGLLSTLACGKNKPAELFNKYLDVGLAAHQARYLHHELYPTLLALSFHDRAKCHFITNIHRANLATNHSGDNVPAVIEGYRLHMGSVDRVNRAVTKVTWPHKNHRWTMCFFWYAIALCVSNARVFYKAYFNVNYKIMEFTASLLTEWIETLPTRSFAPHPKRHSIQKLPSLGRCERCKHIDRNIGKTNYWCKECECYLHPECTIDDHIQ